MVDLSVDYAGLTFKNPVIVAAGPISSTPYTINKCIEEGAGGVIVKSVCLDSETQVLPKPGNFFLDKPGERGGLMHRWAGLLSQEDAISYIKQTKPNAEKENVRLIGSFFFIGRWTGIDPFEPVEPFKQPPINTLREMAQEMEAAGADAIEVVCTCGLSMTPSETVDFTDKVIPKVYEALKGHLSIPFWMKLGFGHDVFWLRDMGAIQHLGGNHIHQYSDFRITYLDIENARPPLTIDVRKQWHVWPCRIHRHTFFT